MTIKLGKGGKPLMVGGKVVTNCDCCAQPIIGDLIVTFTGVVRCCFSAPGAFAYKLFNDLNGTFTVPKVADNTWEIVDPSTFNTVSAFSDACITQVSAFNYGGKLSITLSGSVWTVNEFTTIGGVDCYDFSGSGSSPVSNSLSCGGSNAAGGGQIAIAF